MTLEGYVARIQLDVKDMQTALAGHTGQIDTNTLAIDAVAEDLENLRVQVDTMALEMDAMETAVRFVCQNINVACPAGY